ncbi:MAG: transcription termination factor Rho [Verrucomicrobiales bacterium]|nr:transcription termination factor Rho [Verrucomicrobiales bacterium]
MVDSETSTLNDSDTGAPSADVFPNDDQPTTADTSSETGGDDSGAPPQTAPPIPERIKLNEFQVQTLAQLYDIGAAHGLRVGGSRSKHQLVFEILVHFARRGCIIEADGVVEIIKDSFGVLRDPRYSYAPLPDDVFVPTALVKRHQLRPSQFISVLVRAPRDHKERFLVAESIVSIEGVEAEKWEAPVPFDKLTPLFPNERLMLENRRTKSVSARAVDIIAPLGKGQRGLICAPPRGGKTILLKEIAQSIQENHPEVHLMILLLDERPEEVTDFQETVRQNATCQITSSTFDEPAMRHQQVAELTLDRAKRLVELGRDVVILLDSLTRLTRGINNSIRGKGPIGSGGIDPRALQMARKWFGVARKVEEGGSLTILATALIETESKMDEVIFEEFKGSGNMEIHLDRELVERRIYPAINIAKSGTRKDDLLYHPDEFRRIGHVRKQMAQMPAGEAMEVLTKNIRVTQANAELLLTGLR